MNEYVKERDMWEVYYAARDRRREEQFRWDLAQAKALGFVREISIRELEPEIEVELGDER